ncbi:MAG: DNA polymerase III subunit epsilon, partial [Alphaproteobacteria bacterium]
ALCRRFKIDNSSREKHGALLDSELLAEVYLELMGGRQKDFGLVTESDTAVGGIHEYQYGNQSVPHRTFSVPQQEQEAHKKHLEDIEDPIWEKIKAS